MRIINVARVTRSFFDNFNRADNTILDRSTDGSKWNTFSFSWKTLSNKATTTDPASSYPLASVSMPSNNVTISLKGVSQGSTAALWVTDSGTWWGVGIDQTTVNAANLSAPDRVALSCNCQACANTSNCASYYYQCNSYYSVCTTWNYQCNATNYDCNAWNAGNCNNNARWPCNDFSEQMCNTWTYVCDRTGNRYCKTANYPCASYSQPCNALAYPCGAANYPCGSYNAVTYYDCNCQTCYPQYVRFIQSVTSSVTTLASWVMSTIVSSFKVITSGSTATIKAYSDSNLTNQISSDLVYTPTGVAVNAKYGIMVKPSTYAQGNTIDEISIEAN